MKIRSFVKDQYSLLPIEVEVSCVNGTHDFDIMGQADSLIKEVKNKIFSAFRSCGFEVPTTKKVFINLRPAEIKKTSLGLDLPIALGILWQTGQLPLPSEKHPFVYGELGLDGSVYQPADIDFLRGKDIGRESLYTGVSLEGLDFHSKQFASLRDYESFQEKEAQVAKRNQSFPPMEEIYLDKELSNLMAAIALGEHSAMFAGPKGSGKSTIVENLAKSLAPLPNEDFAFVNQIGKFFGETRSHRPIVSPHHSSTEMSMIGGGAKAGPGEFTRAHGGCLILDEFLEFAPRVQEALREPMESHCIHVARIGGRRKHPAKFMLLATTNLCPCGDFYPVKKHRCICRPGLRTRYIEKLSGPVLDRFQVFYYCNNESREEDVYLPKLMEKIRAKQKLWEHESLARDYNLESLKGKFSKSFRPDELDSFKNLSRRRKLASFQLALSFSRWMGDGLIDQKFLDLAMQYTVKSFDRFRWALSKDY